MTYISVKGGYELSSIAEKVVHWCVNYFNITDAKRINITLHRDKDLDVGVLVVKERKKKHITFMCIVVNH